MHEIYDAFAQSSVRQYFADSRGRTVCALFGRDLLRVGAPNWLQGIDTITHVLQQILPFVRLFADTGSRERQHFFFFFDTFHNITQSGATFNTKHSLKNDHRVGSTPLWRMSEQKTNMAIFKKAVPAG